MSGLLHVSGIHVGTGGTIGSLVNEIVLPYFPVSSKTTLHMPPHVTFQGEDRMVAYLGITMKVCSIIGLLTVGRLLDWTKAF